MIHCIPLKWLDFSISTATSSHSWNPAGDPTSLGWRPKTRIVPILKNLGGQPTHGIRRDSTFFRVNLPVGRLFKGYHHELLAGVWKTSLKETEPSGKRSEVNNSTGFNIFFCNCHLSPKIGGGLPSWLSRFFSQRCFQKKNTVEFFSLVFPSLLKPVPSNRLINSGGMSPSSGEFLWQGFCRWHW